MAVGDPRSGRSSACSICLRLPSSQAASTVMAFASPMPLYSHSSRIDFLPSVFRLLLQSFSTCLISSTAVSFVEPEPMRMASSSALLSACAPFCISFSRGRSSSAHWVMLSFPALSASVPAKPVASVFGMSSFIFICKNTQKSDYREDLPPFFLCAFLYNAKNITPIPYL